MSDTELLDFLEAHKEYVLGYAPSGAWSAFQLGIAGRPVTVKRYGNAY